VGRTVSTRHLYTHYRRQKVGQSLEMRIGHERAQPSGLAVLEQLHVEWNSKHPHSHPELFFLGANGAKATVNFVP